MQLEGESDITARKGPWGMLEFTRDAVSAQRREEREMCKLGKVILATALICTIALAATACANNSGGSTEGESTDSAEATDGVFAVSKIVYYPESRSFSGSATYDLDEHGNVQKSTVVKGSLQGVWEYELDENGFATNVVQPDGQEDLALKTTLEGGKPSKTEKPDGEITEYRYHDNGMPSETVTKVGDSYTKVSSYDENGYLTEEGATYVSTESEMETVVDYAWEFDESGNPVSVTLTEAKVDERLSLNSLPAGKYTVECDTDGNIVRVFNAESGMIVNEYEYVWIDNPSPSCRFRSAFKEIHQF